MTRIIEGLSLDREGPNIAKGQVKCGSFGVPLIPLYAGNIHCYQQTTINKEESE